MTHDSEESHNRYTIELGDRGRLVLPADVRRRLGLEEGERLILTVEGDGDLRLVSLREQVRRLRGLLKDVVPGRDLAGELIEERREEARREDS
jgi:AbrB family looped-hinge helix DNA binding protein